MEKNQTLHLLILKSFSSIHRRIESRNFRSSSYFRDIMEDNKAEIEVLSEWFQLNREQTFLLISSCLAVIESDTAEFNIHALARYLKSDVVDLLFQQKNIEILLQREYWEQVKYNNHSRVPIALLNKEFALHSSISKYLCSPKQELSDTSKIKLVLGDED